VMFQNGTGTTAKIGINTCWPYCSPPPQPASGSFD
jgi:hypothetical protein